ncbi:hypothetical protein CO051_01005 [Candidatus Roizmanbacteria bacterium CG_4_9_14_0_2_um_filter_39_13]|uniref:Uncharacterized protein n=2 Tax=Candidatus Roizmaniibacteriota TaxID=1752723 RepID=A0A2M8F3H0_9BACT|nr:MAG: hypothetical protein COY15_05520 [Candidatus Roizmanbacteria bacterium CG_4_10_14_0_2_um_filter_39_12]PJC33790.1 MAG: hypothetical protein CO051_01005 [Candidatus Roizmanbacteria bacterium CG_4_9_14_0_2_um_filter_39_13]PJE61447.1 MAG: hypothetical protein COU87_04575 [Candidatus Roizmanbacteria bacterium CG10_big_fil_rev_8_21_14_0_10_39_12]
MDPTKTDKPETPTDATVAPVVPPVTPPTTSPEAGIEIPNAPAPEPIAQVIPSESTPEVVPPADIPPTPEVKSPEGDQFGYTETKSNKLLYVFVFVLVVVLLSLVGLFFYKQYMNTTAQVEPVVEPTVAVSPTSAPATEEESELNQIEIPDLDQEMQDINKDIEQL